jgi:hypothetical protein
MVWLFKPEGRQPRGGVGGSPNQIGHTIEGVEGAWDVWLDPSTTFPPCVSYVSVTPREALEFDLAGFIRDAVKNNFIVTQNMYLSVIFAGFEIWGGGDGIQMKKFCVNVN